MALAEHFAQVHATDVAPEQIAAAKPHPRVRYSVAPAERSGLADGSVDLVTVAQALHWFDVTAFYAEAARVARPGALLAVWNYPRPQFVDAELDRRFFAFYSAGGRAVLAATSAGTSRRATGRCRFRSRKSQSPEFGLELDWNLEQVTGYVSSWSATARYRQALGADPVPLLRESLARRLAGGRASVADTHAHRAARRSCAPAR